MKDDLVDGTVPVAHASPQSHGLDRLSRKRLGHLWGAVDLRSLQSRVRSLVRAIDLLPASAARSASDPPELLCGEEAREPQEEHPGCDGDPEDWCRRQQAVGSTLWFKYRTSP
jgi:hypothetical protein